MPDPDELRTRLAAIAERLDRRIDVWRTILDRDGNVIARLFRGSHLPPPPGPGDTNDDH